MSNLLDFHGFVAQPIGAVVGSHDNTDRCWTQAIRYPGCWKVVGYRGIQSDADAWDLLEGDEEGSRVSQLYVDVALSRRPPTESAAIVEGQPERARRIRAQTDGLETGWYVTTGLFWHDDPMVIEGPFPDFETARLRRAEIERSAGPVLWLDVVEEIPAARADVQ